MDNTHFQLKLFADSEVGVKNATAYLDAQLANMRSVLSDMRELSARSTETVPSPTRYPLTMSPTPFADVPAPAATQIPVLTPAPLAQGRTYPCSSARTVQRNLMAKRLNEAYLTPIDAAVSAARERVSQVVAMRDASRRLFGVAVPACTRPDKWCGHNGATYRAVDCLGDGVVGDHICTDTTGRRGTILRSDNCTSAWPNASGCDSSKSRGGT